MDKKFSQRLSGIPPYLFASLDEIKKKMQKEGKRVFDLGVGDPDLPTVAGIVERAKIEVGKPENHRYPSYSGSMYFRRTAAEYIMKGFGPALDPEKNIIALIGSKEGIAHLPLAFVDPGDEVLIPEPGYPVYRDGTLFAGGRPVYMPLLKENGFLPDLEYYLKEHKPRIVWINYPNNPTGVKCTDEFFRRSVELAQKHGFILASDAAYIEVFKNGTSRPRSILEFPGSEDCAIEFHSFSKMFNMTGWRVGFACGNEHLVTGLGKIKKSVDSGIFDAIQNAVSSGLFESLQKMRSNMEIYFHRRTMFESFLPAMGLRPVSSDATFYVWAEISDGLSSAAKTEELLKKYGILASPGTGFGPSGEGYLRFSLTISDKDLSELAGSF